MTDYLFNLEASVGLAFAIYFVAGILFTHGNKRIRWYAFSAVWVSIATTDYPFYVETCILLIAFNLCESIFKMYQPEILALATKKKGS